MLDSLERCYYLRLMVREWMRAQLLAKPFYFSALLALASALNPIATAHQSAIMLDVAVQFHLERIKERIK